MVSTIVIRDQVWALAKFSLCLSSRVAVNDEILKETFKCCGSIKYVRVLQTDKGCNGTAFVCFEKPESVALALELNGTLVLNREMRVSRYSVKELGGGQKKILIKKKSTFDGAPRRLAAKGVVTPAPKEKKGKNQPAFMNKNKDADNKPAKTKKGNALFAGAKSNEKKKVNYNRYCDIDSVYFILLI